MKKIKINNKNYKFNYEFKNAEIVYLFLNGLGGTKYFFSEFKKYTSKNIGYIFIDLPGYGLSKFKKKPKNILKIHFEILCTILKDQKINKINLVLFSLSTVYLKYIIKNSFFGEKINKIFLLDPVIKKTDLEWSIKLYNMQYKDYLVYINNYKQNINKVFQFSLINKKAKFKHLIKNIDTFDNKYLYLINKLSVKTILEKKITSVLKKFNTVYIYPENKKNIKKIYKNKIIVKNSGHYLFIENPKIIYKTLLRYGKLNTKPYRKKLQKI